MSGRKRTALIALALLLALLSLALPVAGSYWMTDHRREDAMTRARDDRAEQTRLIQVNRRNVLRICAALHVECEP